MRLCSLVVSARIGNSTDVLFADVNFVYSPHISLHLNKSPIVFGMAIEDK